MFFNKKSNEPEKYDYTSKPVPGDDYAFDVTVKQPDGKSVEFRVLTFGEVKSDKIKLDTSE